MVQNLKDLIISEFIKFRVTIKIQIHIKMVDKYNRIAVCPIYIPFFQLSKELLLQSMKILYQNSFQHLLSLSFRNQFS